MNNRSLIAGFAEEELFNRLLSLERKRTDRTANPFALMLVELNGLRGSLAPAKLAGMCGAIRAETRATDIAGWYEHSGIIGVIFTALNSTDRDLIRSALMQKAARALGSVLDPAGRENMAISLHFYPEDIDGGKPAFKSDEKLYPDLVKPGGPGDIYHFLKRTIDIAGSLCGLVFCAPLFLIIPPLIKLTSPGPVLFKQRRLGWFGNEFVFLKFRTMYTGNQPDIHRQYVQKLIWEPNPQAVYKIVGDPRVTPLGRFLRATSLDELPQFLNVLRGDMSLVGPRPPIPYEVAYYRHWHKRRVIEVKPGITGLWQVYGRSRTTFDDMVRLDLRYVLNQSLWMDIKILLKTPLAVLSGKGAY